MRSLLSMVAGGEMLRMIRSEDGNWGGTWVRLAPPRLGVFCHLGPTRQFRGPYAPEKKLFVGPQTEAQSSLYVQLGKTKWAQTTNTEHPWRQQIPTSPPELALRLPQTFPISFALLPLHPSPHHPQLPAPTGDDTTPAAAAHGLLLG